MKYFGYNGGNKWSLSPQLDQDVFAICLKHTQGKPVLVFCPTRRSMSDVRP